MATDIAFTLGVIALVGSRAPVGLKVFITALAIADDIGAILVIALFYSESIGGTSLVTGIVLLSLSVVANAAGVRNSVVYFLIGTLAWLAFLESGVHATLAALLLALTIPAKTKIDGEALRSRIGHSLETLVRSGIPAGKRLLSKDQQDVLQGMARTVEDATAPLQTLEHTLMPFVSFCVLPVFALANGGVVLEGSVLDAFREPVFLGIVLGLFVGKQAGVVLFAWAAVRLGIADLPKGVGWRQIHAAGVLAGIGFTMSLFVGGLAFADPGLRQISKAGVLVGSLLCAVVGWALLRFSGGEER
jgi:NhaA family Na+:H+ antiporter